ncbi:hypothetical protein, partial [Stutzerimonas balearica]|uniref:hypothetical protein n=1 Tax=Stutzerimonas balearica TaxID=74829 RepID=UPI00289D481C
KPGTAVDMVIAVNLDLHKSSLPWLVDTATVVEWPGTSYATVQPDAQWAKSRSGCRSTNRFDAGCSPLAAVRSRCDAVRNANARDNKL